MTLHVVFDDTFEVPEALRALVGVDRFGSLVYQRRTRFESTRMLAGEAGAVSVRRLKDSADVDDLIEQLRRQDDSSRYLFCPSHLVPSCTEDSLVTFLRQIAYAPGGLFMPVESARDRRGWALMRPSLLVKFLRKRLEDDVASFHEQHGEQLVEVRDRLQLIDLNDERMLLDFLSGQFDARHFNAIVRDDYTVTKRSKDREKLKREHDFYRLVPPAMQMFLVQPFDFQDDGETASYRMERVSVPDMALQWVHGALTPSEFERFLDHVFHFIAIRPERRVAKATAAEVRDALYVDKVKDRIAALKREPAYEKLAPLLQNDVGGVDALVERYLDVYGRMRGRFASDRLVIGHGDPCFSNILYSKTNQHLRLIDPRGAAGEDDLYTDPYYDAAKLSHSVVGLYDFINHDMFDIVVDKDMGLRLAIEGAPGDWARPMFRERLEKGGFDPVLTRLCEASLFISMLPLHIDRPRKVLAFALNAASILDEIAPQKTRNGI